ncbi:MAG: KH domain-containing protein, partial [Acidimicrobiales bacterium]
DDVEEMDELDDVEETDDADYEHAPAQGHGATRASRVGDVLDYIARSMADEPDAVEVDVSERAGKVVLSLSVAPDDMGRVIGRRGRTAQAIRALVAAAGARDGVTTSVDIVD